MLGWLKNLLSSKATIAVVGAGVGFFAGQYIPAYFDYANERRQEVSALIGEVQQRSDELENAIRPLMLIAGDAVPVTAAPRQALDEKMLNLFQTLEVARGTLPQSEQQAVVLVSSLRQLKEAAAGVDGSLTAKRLIEAASEFKNARTQYETKLNQLEPTFLEAIGQYLF